MEVLDVFCPMKNVDNFEIFNVNGHLYYKSLDKIHVFKEKKVLYTT